MKYRDITKKISAIFLSAAMVVTLLPSLSMPVFAQNNAKVMPYATMAVEKDLFEVNGTKYKSFEDAVDNCPDNGVVKLLDDISIIGSASAAKNFTIDLNNHIFKIDATDTPGLMIRGNVTIVTREKGNIIAEGSPAIINRGTLNVQGKIDCPIANNKEIIGGTFAGEVNNYGGTISGGYYRIVNNVNGIIKGGYFKEKPDGLADGCIILETNNSDYPYRVCSKDSFGTLEVALGQNMTLSSGVLSQSAEKNTEIQPISIKVSDGYYLPKDYLKGIELNGLTVTISDNGDGLTISGIFTSDTAIKLPDAVKKPIEITPTDENTNTNTTDKPKTGDEMHLGLVISLLIISALAIVMLTVFGRNKRLENK